MRRIVLPLCVIALVACSKSENATTDTAAAAAMAPAPLSLADLAGKWSMKAMNEAGDSTLLTYELTASADPAGWSIKFADRPDPIPVRVMADGDSLIVDGGPYSSALRKDVQVTTHGVMRLQDGKMVGTTIARYSVTTADSVRTIRTEGTRIP
jgi:hypothetical protein